jgi:hypothetical protein
MIVLSLLDSAHLYLSTRDRAAARAATAAAARTTLGGTARLRSGDGHPRHRRQSTTQNNIYLLALVWRENVVLNIG